MKVVKTFEKYTENQQTKRKKFVIMVLQKIVPFPSHRKWENKLFKVHLIWPKLI